MAGLQVAAAGARPEAREPQDRVREGGGRIEEQHDGNIYEGSISGTTRLKAGRRVTLKDALDTTSRADRSRDVAQRIA